MEAIFDTLFGNILVLLAIIGGIAGFIKDKSGKGNETSKPYTSPQPVNTSSSGRYETGSEEIYTDSANYVSSSITRDEQPDTHRAVENGEHDALSGIKQRKLTPDSKKNSVMRKQISRNLTKQGLVNGIIMNEVIGPPRAMKPYRSITEQRRK